MKILLTNDDGVGSPGIRALKEALDPYHEVWVLAPEGERSASSHCITIKEPVRFTEVRERVYAAGGMPADCVILGLLDALDVHPEVVISGINLGPNLGSDIIFSGTAAAARQAALMGVPGIATSVDSFTPPFYFEALTAFVVSHLEELVSLWNDQHFVNINAPNAPGFDKPVEITSPCVRVYHDRLSQFSVPRGDTFFFMHGSPAETDLVPGTDWHAVSNGAISVSPIFLNPVNNQQDVPYRNALFVSDTRV